MNQLPDDKTIIDRINSGDKEAYVHLLKRYEQKVFQTCMGFLHDNDEAADLTQEIFIKIYEKLHSFKGKSSFSTWLYRVTMNMAINYKRKMAWRSIFQPQQQSTELFDETGSYNADSHLKKTEQKKLIKRVLDKLTKQQRKAFVLSHYRELSNNELADVLDISLKAAESLLFRARTSVNREIKNYK
jgi:RNA polymerase sigma-70 factor (ECF subfamily)